MIEVETISLKGTAKEEYEDYAYVDKNKGFFMLADGMSGPGGGRFASKAVILNAKDHVHYIWNNVNIYHDKNVVGYNDALKYMANEVNFNLGTLARETSHKKAATTLDMLLLSKNLMLFSHVGDGRIYVFYTGKLKQLTEDHNLSYERYLSGKISKEEASAASNGVLTNYYGRDDVYPTVDKCSLYEVDCILMVTDGVTSTVSDKELEDILKESFSIVENPVYTKMQYIKESITERIIYPKDMANAYAKAKGVSLEEAKQKLSLHDDATAIIICFGGGGE